MEAYRAKATVEQGGWLHLGHLPFSAGERVEVVVSPAELLAQAWPDGYFRDTFGVVRDENFFRHAEGEFESREPLV